MWRGLVGRVCAAICVGKAAGAVVAGCQTHFVVYLGSLGASADAHLGLASRHLWPISGRCWLMLGPILGAFCVFNWAHFGRIMSALFRIFRGHFGRIFWLILSSHSAFYGSFWMHYGAHCDPTLGPFRGAHFAPTLGHLVPKLRSLLAFLGISWAICWLISGLYCAYFGAHVRRVQAIFWLAPGLMLELIWAHFGLVCGLFWRPIVARLGPILVALVGLIFGLFGAHSGVQLVLIIVSLLGHDVKFWR